jgi:hypothetical protein
MTTLMPAAPTAPPPQPLASDVLGECELSAAARAHLAPGIKLASFLAQLAREQLWTDALRAAAFGLPRPSAVWWGCLCLWEFYRPTPPAEIDRCLAAVVDWLKEPTDARRREAQEAALAAKVTTPGGNLAMAVFFSEGSISPVDQPAVPAKPHHLPQMIAAATNLAVQKSPRNLVEARATDFVRMALEVLAGRWPLPVKEGGPS